MGEYGKKLYELQNKVVINVKPLKFGVEEVEAFREGGVQKHSSIIIRYFSRDRVALRLVVIIFL
jgi:hypothetical protein